MAKWKDGEEYVSVVFLFAVYPSYLFPFFTVEP